MMRYLSSRSRAATAAKIDNLFITDLHRPPLLFFFIVLAKGSRHILSQDFLSVLSVANAALP